MESICQKLSPLISGEGTSFNDYLKMLYPIYKEKIADGMLTFRGKPVCVFNELNFNLQHQTFEHLTTKGNNDRLYNQKRCERIAWISDILHGICEGCDNYRVFRDTKWKSNRNFKRYIIWCVKEDYVIILEEREKQVMLITAYCVLYPSKRHDLEKEFAKSLK